MQLAESIKENGVIHPLIIWKWKGILVDGHNRFRICKELGIPYSTQEMEFADANATKTWMIKNQLGRRNVNAFVKVELVLPLRDSLLEEGRKNHGRLRVCFQKHKPRKRAREYAVSQIKPKGFR